MQESEVNEIERIKDQIPVAHDSVKETIQEFIDAQSKEMKIPMYQHAYDKSNSIIQNLYVALKKDLNEARKAGLEFTAVANETKRMPRIYNDVILPLIKAHELEMELHNRAFDDYNTMLGLIITNRMAFYDIFRSVYMNKAQFDPATKKQEEVIMKFLVEKWKEQGIPEEDINKFISDMQKAMVQPTMSEVQREEDRNKEIQDAVYAFIRDYKKKNYNKLPTKSSIQVGAGKHSYDTLRFLKTAPHEGLLKVQIERKGKMKIERFDLPNITPSPKKEDSAQTIPPYHEK